MLPAQDDNYKRDYHGDDDVDHTARPGYQLNDLRHGTYDSGRHCSMASIRHLPWRMALWIVSVMTGLLLREVLPSDRTAFGAYPPPAILQ